MLGVINKDIQSIHKCTLSDHPLQAHSLGIESSQESRIKKYAVHATVAQCRAL